MRTKLLALTMTALLFTSCGKDNKVVNTPNENSNANAFTADILARTGMPKAKESVRFVQKKYYNTNGFRCAYTVDTDIVVINSDTRGIRFTERNQSTTGTRNSSYCPFYHPTMREYRNTRLTQSQFLDQVRKKINKALNPSVYCVENADWCTNARLLEKKDVQKYGISAIMVEAEFQNRNGHIYNMKSYVSKESLLQNVFEFEMVNIRTGERVDFKRLKPQNRRRRPRR